MSEMSEDIERADAFREQVRAELRREIAQKGGQAVAKKYDKEHFRKLAAKSHAKRRENRGVDNSVS